MDHLACFSGGLYALGAHHIKDSSAEYYARVGAEITSTCHESYKRTSTQLGPESFRYVQTSESINQAWTMNVKRGKYRASCEEIWVSMVSTLSFRKYLSSCVKPTAVPIDYFENTVWVPVTNLNPNLAWV